MTWKEWKRIYNAAIKRAEKRTGDIPKEYLGTEWKDEGLAWFKCFKHHLYHELDWPLRQYEGKLTDKLIKKMK